MAKNKIVLKRHKFYWALGKPIVWFISKIWGYKCKTHFKMEKDQSYIILSNHQTDMDGFIVGLSFNKPYTIIATETVFSAGSFTKIVGHCFSVIAKKKGQTDIRCVSEMMNCIKEGGNLFFFPEGNRAYAEFQYPLTPNFGKFLRHFNKPIILFNLHGGTGTHPRFGNKKRKGNFYGEVKKVLYPSDYANLTNEELEKEIQDNLRVYDSESNEQFESNKKAEYLERMLFVCPKCGKVETLVSSGNTIKCTSCGFEATYNSDLSLTTNDENVKINKLVDWYNLQINYIKNCDISDGVIFSNNFAKALTINRFEKRKVVGKGKVNLTKDKITIGDFSINVADIKSASPISGTDLWISTENCNYLVKGEKRFNPLKYVLMFNKLNDNYRNDSLNIYYNLEEKH